jgi:hypothetical protein
MVPCLFFFASSRRIEAVPIAEARIGPILAAAVAYHIIEVLPGINKSSNLPHYLVQAHPGFLMI